MSVRDGYGPIVSVGATTQVAEVVVPEVDVVAELVLVVAVVDSLDALGPVRSLPPQAAATAAPAARPKRLSSIRLSR
jgi:hypothetical protein